MSQRFALAYGGAAPKGDDDPTTLLEALARASHEDGEKGILYLQTDGSEIIQSYKTLCEKAERILAGLRALGLRAGDKVILQVEENWEYLPTFWACVLGGLIAVPISIAPSYAQPSATTIKLQKAWELCEHPIVIASASLAPALRSLAPVLGMESVRVETVDVLYTHASTPDECVWYSCQPDDVFIILFTSGSTGIPKGVMLTHRNVLSLAQGFTQLEGLSCQEVSFNWMPLDHIAGLVTFHLRDVYLGCRQIHASPQTILQNPLKWLDCLDRYHATCTWAPNFAFSLLNEHISALTQERNWDLSALHYILNAGEAIVPKTARRFLELLCPYGLPQTAIHPSWGMSETSSGVTFSSRFSLETTTDEDRFTDVGALIHDVWVRIVDMQDQLLIEGESGRVQVQGPTVTPGYYHHPDLNREAFTSDGWFDTGDVGSLSEGRLTITGRTKNIIIINGLNYYCHEIEAVVEECPGVEVTYTGACAVRDASNNTDALIIFYCSSFTDEREILKQYKEIRQRVVNSLGINPAYLLPVTKDAIPKTETGKIQRGKLKQQFEDGLFDPIRIRMELLLSNSDWEDESSRLTEIEQQLLPIWQQVLNETGIHKSSNFFELGGHSLIIMQLLARVQETFHVTLSPRSLFDFPTLTTLAQQIEYYQQRIGGSPNTAFVPVSREGHLLPSFSQQGLWFLDHLNPGSTSYAIYGAFHLQGQLHIPALEASLQEIVQRHETLRTTFHSYQEELALSIAPHLPIVLSLISLQNLPPEKKMLTIQSWISQEVQRPFDLEQGPLVRFTLLQLAQEEHLFFVSFHHSIADGWSMGVFNQELAALYSAFRRGEPAEVATLPMQFVDFAAWQQRRLQGEFLERELSWWKQRLAGAPALVALPTDRPRPAIQTDHGAHCASLVPLTILQSLKLQSQQENTTLFMTLLAAFSVLLFRYCGQEDLVVGTILANRSYKEFEPLIGYFANTLALRIDVSKLLSFRELLRQVRESTLEAYAHQELPFSQLVETLHPERNLSYTPLVQVVFVLQNQQTFTLELEGLTIRPFPFESCTAKFDFLLEVVETEAGLQCVVEYNTDLFEARTIERMLAHLQILLEAIVRDPEQAIADLPLLTQGERDQLLRHWNATRREVAKVGVPQLFEAQVAATPEALALLCGPSQLSYRELDQRANQLAHYLRRLGVGPEVLVGLFVERSVEMVVALLAILKAGGAYLPLDPMYPKERLAFLLADAQVSVVLTQESLVAQMPEYEGPIVLLDGDHSLISAHSNQSPSLMINGEQLAYVLYTSGSTGRPKGVQIVHRNLTNLLLAMRERPGMGAQDRLLAVTTLSFDIAGLELYLPLISGGQVILASRDVAGDGELLARMLDAHGITVMQATPATWQILREAGWAGRPGLKMLCGGEALLESLARFLLERGAELWNMYGPTETTIYSTGTQVQINEGIISLGGPIANTQLYLLDASLHPVPIGVTGELYIGGAGLARGYVNRADLTAERFIPDPFSGEAGARLYRTGDLARYLPDGGLDYLGRLDNQVKIRGFRIELGEIETALARHPVVRACVVGVREDSAGEKRLLAYLVPQAGAPIPSRQELRTFLQHRLPDYMLPSAFLVLDALPLTPNGKADRRALLALDAPLLAVGSTYVPPSTSVEQVLAEIWEEVLGVPQVGIQDNFFALGGDSFLGIHVISLARNYGIFLQANQIFQHQTIAELSSIVDVIRL